VSHSADTIAALSSGTGRAGVAVVRLSGPGSAGVAELLARRRPKPRKATLARLFDPADGALIDEGLLLLFPAPHSYTGEDVLELQVHGSRAVVRKLLDVLAALPGIRLAESGEFTRRAFENGRLDLLAVEDLASLIDSDTELQRRVVIEAREGRFRRYVERWRDAMLELLALIETEIDFGDEGDVPDGLVQNIRRRAAVLATEIDSALNRMLPAERVQEGYRVVLAGRPNAGKSSLLNVIAGREVAIVSAIAGTTRDVIEVRLDLGGVPVLLQDVAGLRETDDEVEAIGVARARQAMASADLVIWLTASGEAPDIPAGASLNVVSKGDLSNDRPRGARVVSARTGEGIAELLDEIGARAAESFSGSEDRHVVNARQEQALRACLRHLRRSGGIDADQADLIAEELRGAANAARSLLGEIGIEDVLGHIFARFCIGK